MEKRATSPDAPIIERTQLKNGETEANTKKDKKRISDINKILFQKIENVVAS